MVVAYLLRKPVCFACMRMYVYAHVFIVYVFRYCFQSNHLLSHMPQHTMQPLWFSSTLRMFHRKFNCVACQWAPFSREALPVCEHCAQLHLGEVFQGPSSGWCTIWPAAEGRSVACGGIHEGVRVFVKSHWWVYFFPFRQNDWPLSVPLLYVSFHIKL